MRCRGCEYELWNMKPGTCPECGRKWQFDEFRFHPLAAQFLCPHCDHAYGGTDNQGLPTPRAFICSGCSEPIDLDQMRALPAPNTDGSTAMDDEFPWRDIERLGKWRAFWRTVGLSMSNPTRVGRMLPERSSFRSALIFSLLCGTITIVSSASPIVFMIGFSNQQFSSGLEYVLQFLAIFFAVVLGFAILAQILLLLWGSCAHGILRISGGVHRPLRDSLSSTLFCTGPFLISAIPCCGFYIFLVSVIWMGVAMIHALASLQRVSRLRASIAVLAPLLSLFAAIALTVAVMIYMSSNTTWSANGVSTGFSSSVQIAPSSNAVAPPTPPDESDAQALPPLGPESPEEK